MRKYLFITFDFPPRRTSAVYRHVGLTKFLGRYGWTPTVLSVQGTHGEVEDYSLLADYPSNIDIVRTEYLDVSAWEKTAGKLARKLTGKRPQSKSPDGAGASSPVAVSVSPKRSKLQSLLSRLGDFVQATLYFPDRTIGWLPFALRAGLKLHKEHHFDLIYTSSPPKSAPLAGYLLKLWTGLPWAAEFRDPWYPPKGRIRAKLERALLRLILKNADAIVLISKGLAAEFQSAFDVPAEKISVITNGYDECDFEKKIFSEDIFSRDYFQISHFGEVYQNFSGDFFPALEELFQETPALKQRIRVNIIGFPDEHTKEFAKKPGLEGVIQLHPFMEHLQALEAMYSSDALLVFLANEKTCRLSGLGKIFWYLRVGRPILAIAHPGGTQELVEAAEAGYVLDPKDNEAIKKALRQVLNHPRNGAAPQPQKPELVATLRYEALAEQLATLLTRATQ